ncbi:MAG: TetR/AcrR family transcriptional regulator [Candidatus Afipia apatlaquensis]|uniref:TetR/AcrR family transcriptional regulator n=1 Tax=Candidatus Afipia apatlaquensis TaxID=2712852 RepID=A0A7C9VPZ8_9BRAD|nr:TetR/AcrR family transcriptional regulator [Candidatus Afipia apatlaquensis]
MSEKPDSKEKTVLAAASLLRRHGYNGTALSDILATAGSPRGSLYFHFPNGKEEIAVAALKLAADSVRKAIAGAAKTSKSADEFLIRIVRGMAADLERSDFKEGCPIAPTALEVSGTSEALTGAVSAAFQGWEQEIAAGLQWFRFDAGRAKLLATAALSQLEGALLLARTYQSMEPLQRAEEPIRVLVRAFAKA